MTEETKKEPVEHPGEILLMQFMRPRHMRITELAYAMGCRIEHLASLIAGNRDVTNEDAVSLANLFSTQVGFWLRLQHDYDVSNRRWEKFGDTEMGIFYMAASDSKELERCKAQTVSLAKREASRRFSQPYSDEYIHLIEVDDSDTILHIYSRHAARGNPWFRNDRLPGLDKFLEEKLR